MLQQTTVATVKPRFRRFLERWPTIADLAAARDEEVLQEWAGLGYYARARNLIACARTVASRGGFPSTAAELRDLPGLGDYTSAAIAAIAFGEPVAAVDTNVERVVARLAGIDKTIVEARRDIRHLAQTLVPHARPGDFAQAIMDLGATVCRPIKPACNACPLGGHCSARLSGQPERYPAPKAKKDRSHRHGIARWIEQDGAIWLVRRPAKGLLGGMPALPDDGWTADAAPPHAIARVSHGFTHFTLDLHLVEGSVAADVDGWWQPLSGWQEAGLPTLYARAVEAVLARKDSNDD